MIGFDLTQETPAHATGLIVEPKGQKSEGSLSFSALLQGIKEGDEISQNSALLLSLDDSNENKEPLKGSKGEVLRSLLQDSESDINELKLLEINPELKESLSTQDFKQLIKDAKNYLQEQISQTDGFKSAEIETLPKTLKGLTEVAQKFGLDLSSVTLEEVQTKSTSQTSKDSILTTDKTVDTIIKSKKTLDIQTKSSEDITPKSNSERKESAKEATNNSTLLFQLKKTTSNISTEQIVNSKIATTTSTEVPVSKKRDEDTLKLLLQGEKNSKSEDTTLTKDFSVASAKVIAPTPKREASASLESLLQPENITSDDKDESVIKNNNNTLNVAKADSFEVKINEAKQMIKYLSQDVKQAIDNYKAPFTRVKVQLNPQQLGEIDLTVVQRGKNLHVNLSSNNAAINTLAMNANDLKVQLQNSGINNASLNFSNNSQGQDQAASQQQQQQNRQNAKNEYNYFENEENEEIVSSLEIVVPNYA